MVNTLGQLYYIVVVIGALCFVSLFGYAFFGWGFLLWPILIGFNCLKRIPTFTWKGYSRITW